MEKGDEDEEDEAEVGEDVDEEEKENRVETFLVKIAETLVVELELAPSWRLLQAWFHVSLMIPEPFSLHTVQGDSEKKRTKATHEEG